MLGASYDFSICIMPHQWPHLRKPQRPDTSGKSRKDDPLSTNLNETGKALNIERGIDLNKSVNTSVGSHGGFRAMHFAAALDSPRILELLLKKGYEVHGIIRRSSSFNTGRINHIINNKRYDGIFFFYHGEVIPLGY